MIPFRRPWLLYILFLALGLGAMGWVTRQALASEQAERLAQARAMVEEKVRLVLWRMDSTMALFLTPEAARPWHHFETFHREGGRSVASPMLVMDDPMVLLRFQWEERSGFSSPLVPPGKEREQARRAASDPARLGAASQRLAGLGTRLTGSELRRAMVEAGGTLTTWEQMEELRARSRGGRSALGSPFEVIHGAWTPFWLDQDLVMARQVWIGDRELLQGIWLDWAAVKEILQSVSLELLPGATFEPLPPGTGPEVKDRRMSSLPVRLVPGRQRVTLPGAPPRHTLLWMGWGMVLLGALAGGWVLRRGLELGERQVAFASAVTHELRSPMTTFKLYTELLARDMVPDPTERQEMLGTLMREAERLDHLVKNVLAFARLEAGREASLEAVEVGGFLARIRPRLEARVQEAGLFLQVEVPEGVAGRRLRVDPLLVEQVLFNLVDNAAKYAAGAPDPTVRLEAVALGGKLGLRVRDHGPGIDPADRGALFRPFHKSVQKAARSVPGVGLGLALSRGLARSLGGDLVWQDPGGVGTAFLLTLPEA